MRWYADNSELCGIREATIPDILLFGGVAVPPESDQPLRAAVEGVKARYGSARAPVKWNMKDLGPVYERQRLTDLYDRLLAESKSWRLGIFEATKDLDFTVIISVLETHSIDRKEIKKLKSDLSGFAFCNGLMRLALHAQNAEPERVQVVLDWPDKSDPKPFDTEYARAYKRGESAAGVAYFSGPLYALGFADSVVYTNMNHSTPMQFADLVLGACREAIEFALDKKDPGLGLKVTKAIAHRYYGAPGSIYGRGINVASGDNQFKQAIFDFVSTQLV